MKREAGIISAELSDQEVIKRVKAGEKELYALLIQRYNQRLYRVAISILRDDHEAEEAMQVAYIKAWENLGKFEMRSSFSTWLTRILINESLLRKKRKLVTNEITDEASVSNNINLQTPFMKLANSELKNILEKAIAALPEKYRLVFVMREIENLPVNETSECLGLTSVNVKVRLNRAKAMLRESLNTIYKKEDLFSFHLSRCERITERVMLHIISAAN